jgi:pimeloyl-ACP methyl ester carboxylesterase
MSEPLLHKVQCLSPAGLHHMAYWEWGERDNPRVLVCVHGLARQGRDFDWLARAMSEEYRVICPDVVGRGRSDRLANPALYQVPTYVADMVTLIARVGVEQVHWVGTSMGGLIGMGLASLSKSPITRLVLNDVGPAIEFEAIQRIGTYLGQPLRFDSVEHGAAYLRSISQPFGPHSDEDWLTLSRPMLHADGEGRFRLHYDPAIAVPFRAATPEIIAAGEAMLWQSYERIACPTLLLRGADSDLLSRATAEAMTQRGPCAQLHEFAGVGHAPTLVAQDQIEVLRQFLLASP